MSFMEQMESYPEKLVARLIDKQKKTLMTLQNDNTAIAKEIAALTAMTKEVAVKRTLIHHYFEERMQDRETIMQTASNLLDISIQKGNTEMADVALQIIHMLKNDNI